MILPDLTARTALGAVDLVPFFRRARGDHSAPIPAGERYAAVLALAALGWATDPIAKATALNSETVRETLAGRYRPAPMRATGADNPAESSRERRVRLRAERVEVDGRLVHPRAPHGTRNGSAHYGCQCEPCAAARVAAKRRTA